MSNTASTTKTSSKTSTPNGKTPPAAPPPPPAADVAPPAAPPAATPRTGPGRRPTAEMTPEAKARMEALHLSWPKLAAWLPNDALDIEATKANFAKAIEAYLPFAHKSSASVPRMTLSVEDVQRLAPIARDAFDKFAKATPDYGKAIKLDGFVDALFTAMGFNSLADEADAQRGAIQAALTEKLGYERAKTAEMKDGKSTGKMVALTGKAALLIRSGQKS